MGKENEKYRQEVILDSINEGVFTVDLDWKITAFNRAAERITGVQREDAIGQACCDVFHASICENECALRRTFESAIPVVNATAHIISNKGMRVPIRISAAILRDDDGRVIIQLQPRQYVRCSIDGNSDKADPTIEWLELLKKPAAFEDMLTDIFARAP